MSSFSLGQFGVRTYIKNGHKKCEATVTYAIRGQKVNGEKLNKGRKGREFFRTCLKRTMGRTGPRN